MIICLHQDILELRYKVQRTGANLDLLVTMHPTVHAQAGFRPFEGALHLANS